MPVGTSCLAGCQRCKQGPQLSDSVDDNSLPAACAISLSSVRAAQQGGNFRSDPAWFLRVLQPKCVLSSAIVASHLILVGNQQQWRCSLVPSLGTGAVT